MPAFEAALDRDEIEQVIDYVIFLSCAARPSWR